MTAKTKFQKITNLPKWALYFGAGEQWLKTYELVRDRRNAPESVDFLFWVEPHVLYFAIELLVKSIAARENPSFDAQKDMNSRGRKIGHSATDIIEVYKAKVPIFFEVAENQKLFNLIKTYEATIDTRFGETAVSINGEDAKLMFGTAKKLWSEIDTTRKT